MKVGLTKNLNFITIICHTKFQFAKKSETMKKMGNGTYFVTKIVLTYCEKKFTKFLRSQEQFIQTKVRTIFGNRMLF